MTNTLSDKIKIAVLLLSLIVMSGCNPEAITEVIELQEESKLWLIDADFDVEDSNGMGQSFHIDSSDSYYLEGSSSTLGITTNITLRAYMYQRLSSSSGDEVCISVTAPYEPLGDELCFSFNGLSVSYDLKYNLLSSVSYIRGVDSYSLSMLAGEEGYFEDEDVITSVGEVIENYTLNGVEYDKVFHFVLNDFQDVIDSNNTS